MKKQEKIKAWIARHPLWTMFISLFMLLQMISVYSGLHPFYYATGPITGTVVDKATGKPIEGAVAVLQFSLVGGAGNLHGTRTEAIYLAESVTDTDGRYHFAAWRAKHVYLMRAISQNPVVGVYRRGYKPSYVFNDGRNNEQDFEFAGNNAQIELERYQNLDEEIDAIKRSSGLWGVGIGMKCADEKVPNFIVESSERIKRVLPYLPKNQNNISAINGNLVKKIETMTQQETWKNDGCQDPRIVFKEYLETSK